EALDAAELGPDDIEQVLVTHAHPDHFGLASRLREQGADVVTTKRVASVIGDFAGHFEFEREYFMDFLPRCGLGEETAKTVTGLPGEFLSYAPPVEVDRILADGDTLSVDDTPLTARETEGHAASELLLEFDRGGRSQLVVGDHVLPQITPNPLLQAPEEPGAERPRMLPTYNDSLDALADAPPDRILPGHREIIEDPASRLQEIRAAHEERTENVFDLVDGPTTPLDVMDGLFGDLPATEVFSGMSEAVGHLDVLVERERVRRRERGGLFVYERRQ
ncbi:MAG: MBL fold metallo-hydrolase, partial [Salinirussus sp.]